MSKDLSKLTELLEMGEDGDFSIDISSVKKRELKTKTVSIFMESGVYKDMVNRPFIFILLPFFSPQRQRNLNLIYEIENAGIKFSSSLSNDPLEDYTNKQPGEFEKNVLDFIMWKFQGEIEKEDKEKAYEVNFTVSEVVDYLGLNYHSSYYRKVEEALYNLQETTYRVRIKNQKKAGNIIREVYEKPLNLIRYRKIKEKNIKGGKEKVSYHVELDRRIIDELKIKHYSIFDKDLLSGLRKKNKMAERIYQFISMKRFTSTTGIFRIETLASIIPLNLYAIIRKKNKDGVEKEYKVSKKKSVLKKLVKAFEDLVELEYISSFEVIELKEEKTYKIKYNFNITKDNSLHKSTFLTGNIEDGDMGRFQEEGYTEEEHHHVELCTDDLDEELKVLIEKWKKEFALAKEEIQDIQLIIGELCGEFGKNKVIEELKLFSIEDIMNLEGKLRDYLEEEKHEEAEIVNEKSKPVTEKKIPQSELEVFKTLYASFTEKRQHEIDKRALDIYKEELGSRELKIFDLTNYEKEDIKMLYIRKAIKEVIGI